MGRALALGAVKELQSVLGLASGRAHVQIVVVDVGLRSETCFLVVVARLE
jgi:hypothetical protein